MQLTDFDFDLPAALVAQHPAAVRSGARLLDGMGERAVDRQFVDFVSLLREDDLLLFNDTQVIKARLFGQKRTGGTLELLVERVLPGNEVVAHMRSSKRPAVGAALRLGLDADGQGFEAQVLGYASGRSGLVHLRLSADPHALMRRYGHVPLPPYIAHADSAHDEQRYQTVFAKHPGAVAAPTAALHFDATVLQLLEQRGVRRASVTLHIGAGTFQPVKVQDITKHLMHSERFCIPSSTLDAIARCRAQGARVIAVGTTVARTLETFARTGVQDGETDIFITPGFEFALTDMLLTNFHMPKSTLLMLISAFAGHAHVMRLYRHAVAQQYRFLSYGDAMVLCNRVRR